MRRLRNVLSLVLLTASTMSSLVAQASTASGIHDEKPAGCHEHGKKAPVPTPSDYACCMAGHGSALVQTSCMPQPQHVSVPFVLTIPSLPEAAAWGEAGWQMDSSPPPGPTPLRI